MRHFFKTPNPFVQPAIRFDLSHALKVVHQQGVHGGGGFTLNSVTRVSRQGVVERSSREKGDGSEGPSGKDGIDSKKNESDPKKLKKGNQPLFNSVDEHSFHIHDIFTHACEQISAGSMVVPGGGEPLKGGVKIASKI